MGTINDKLTYLDGTKTAIRNVLNEQGINITTEDTFRSYAQKIGNEFDDLNDVIENLPTSTVQGTTINVDDCLGGRNPITIKGNTYQASYEGKNLLPNTTISGTVNGLSVTVNDDKSIKISGTSTTNTYINLTTDFKVLPGTYTLSGCPVGGGQDTYRLQLFYSGYSRFDNGSGDTFTLTTERTYTSARINIPSGVTVNNIIFKPQLEQGSTATDYEPYVGGVPSPNPDYPQDIHVVTGNNTVAVQGKNLAKSFVNGTILNQYQGSIFIDGNFEIGKKYVLSFVDKSVGNSYYRNEHFMLNPSSYSITATGERQTYYFECKSNDKTKNNVYSANKGYIILKNTTALENLPQFEDIQIEEVESYNIPATDYVPYYHAEYPINLGSLELCKIGDVQDFIFKNTPDSEHYDSTLVENAWYKYGNIRKYDTAITATIVQSNSTYRFKVRNISKLHDMPSDTNAVANGIARCAIPGNTGYNVNIRYNYGWGGIAGVYNSKLREIMGELTTEELIQWFNDNETWYILINPTYDYVDITQITDETLISQLEAINKAKWNQGINTITTTVESPNAVPYLSAIYKRLPKYQDKDVTATSNGTTTIQKDEEYDAINSINLNVAVPPNWTEIGYEDTPQTIIDGFNYAKQIQANWNSSINNMSRMFQGDINMIFMPYVDTSNVTSLYFAFADANSLLYLPWLNTSRVTNMTRAFGGCRFTHFPLIDMNKVTSANEMFQNCNRLVDLPLLDTSNVTTASSMFSSCSNLTEIPLLNTYKMTNMGSFLNSCSKLTEIPQFDTSSATNISTMLRSCTLLVTVPLLDTSKVTNFQNFVQSCPNLSNESLNNIMQMCIGATSYTGTKTLKQLGVSSSQATTCTTLSNWQDFVDAGWTTGY